MVDTKAVREKHKPTEVDAWWAGCPKYCDYCHEAYHEPVNWPCDAIQLCDEVDRLRIEVNSTTANADTLANEVDRLTGEVDRLTQELARVEATHGEAEVEDYADDDDPYTGGGDE